MEIVNDERFPHHFTVMIHFYNTLCTIYFFLGYLFWLEESMRVIFLCTYNYFVLLVYLVFFILHFSGSTLRVKSTEKNQKQ